MEMVEENWQSARSTISERTKFMFNNNLLSDVKFITSRNKNGEYAYSKMEIPAHRFVLSISSPVFYSMFHGPMAETSDAIVLPDCEHEALLEFFRYMYSDEVILNSSNVICVMQVLYLAEKYIMPSLVSICFEYLRENVEGSNVVCVLTHSLRCYQQDEELIKRCWEVLDEQTGVAVQTDGFVTIERSLLEELVERDSLTIKEIELFKAVQMWALHQCEKQGLEANGVIKRRIIGERIVTNIRFPVMEEKEFASAVLDSNILRPHEAYVLARYFYSTSKTSPRGFLANKRIGCLKDCHRFESVVKFGWICYQTEKEKKHELNVCVDKAIKMQGVRLFSCDGEQHLVTLEIRDLSRSVLLATKTGSFDSVQLQYKSVSFYGINVLFDEPVALENDIVYKLSSFISGSCSWHGKNALECVQCSGVTFKFDSTKSSKQFPEILFTL